MEFGSDSFLDIVANVVGILVILLVLVGIKVGQHTQEVAEIDEANNTAQMADASAETPIPARQFALPTLSIPQAKMAVAGPIIAVPVESFDANSFSSNDIAFNTGAGSFPNPASKDQILLQRQLQQQIETLRAKAEFHRQQFDTLQSQMTRAEADKSKLENQQEQIIASLNQLQSTTTLESKALADQQQQLSFYEQKIQNLDQEIKVLSKEILDIESSKPLPETLEHKVSPVSRQVAGKEIHFRVKDGRVAYVPLDELTDDLKRRVMNNRSTIMQNGGMKGRVGPVSGFSLKYSIAVEDANAADQLRYGGGLVRVEVEGWEVVPEQDVIGETETEALAAGSSYDTRLVNSRQSTSVTYWVYPDSYGMFRKLQAHAQRMGYQIAARPLPNGMPIIGSPTGSKSRAQ
jgi:hypothetical protein